MNRWDGKKVKWQEYEGKRCIAVEDSILSDELEVLVVEVSPSGKRVKFKFPSNVESWEKSKDWLLIECLEVE